MDQRLGVLVVISGLIKTHLSPRSNNKQERRTGRRTMSPTRWRHHQLTPTCLVDRTTIFVNLTSAGK